MKSIFESGGSIMYILLFASVIAFGVILEKICYYLKNESSLKKTQNSSRSSVGKLMRLLQKEYENNSNIDCNHAEEIAREFILETHMKLEKRLWILSLVANISPLLGLFGTVTGMISAFDVIAVAGTGDPKLLADGISKALITTAGGLSVAMPTAVFVNYFHNKNEELVTLMEKNTVEFLNKLRCDIK